MLFYLNGLCVPVYPSENEVAARGRPPSKTEWRSDTGQAEWCTVAVMKPNGMMSDRKTETTGNGHSLFPSESSHRVAPKRNARMALWQTCRLQNGSLHRYWLCVDMKVSTSGGTVNCKAAQVAMTVKVPLRACEYRQTPFLVAVRLWSSMTYHGRPCFAQV